MHAELDAAADRPLLALKQALFNALSEVLMSYLPGTLPGDFAPSEDGFHADFLPPRALHPDDFPELEQRMRARLHELHELEDLIPLDCFELRSVAGAYHLGDAANVMMTRIHVWACASAEALATQRAQHELAQARDHKRLGRELELFAFDDEIGAGLPLWLPNGTAVRDELEQLMRELEFAAGFERVATPHLAQRALYVRTGHLPYFADGMFPIMQREGEQGPAFVLKPMNCPHHHKIFATRKRSYRELPLRLSEYGHVYRYEDSGAVSGLLRTRCMCMNDGHIYCAPEHVAAELNAVLDMHARVYDILGLTNYRVRLSTRGDDAGQDKFVHDPAGWARAEASLRQVLEQRGMDYYEGPGEAAFYGPKIDFQFRMVTGREETASTLQLDFAMAERLDLSYVGPGGEALRPLILHRAPLGTHERFVALLIERYGGAFPTWLAPVQARVLPVSDAYEPYAKEVQQVLRAQRIRAQLGPAEHSLSKRIRKASLDKVPYVLVVGERERADRRVSVRRHGATEQQSMPLLAACEQMTAKVADRTLDVC